MPKIFLCYSKIDSALAEELEIALRSHGHEIFSNKEIIHSGAPLNELRGFLTSMDGIIILFTKNSIGDRTIEVETEIAISLSYGSIAEKFVLILKYGISVLPEKYNGIEYITINESDELLPQTRSIDNFIKRWNTDDRESPFGPSLNLEFGSINSQYWLIKINENTWNINDFQVGKSYTFEVKHHNGQTQSDIIDFKTISTNDFVFALALPKRQQLVALFRVIQPLHYDDGSEVITIVIDEIFDSPFAIEVLSSQPFYDRLNYDADEKLYPLDNKWAIKLLQDKQISPPDDISTRSVVFQTSSLTHLSPDIASHLIPDDLNFTADVKAIASVIAYKEVKPPLSIGLFGNWGSGKSFFMNKLEKEIDKLSGSDPNVFCEEIIPIHFNSWHYSDANLWASLSSRIYEELDTYGKKNNPGKLENLYLNLHSTTEQIKETNALKEQTENTIKKLKLDYSEKENDVNEKIARLSSVKFSTVAKAVLENEMVKDKINVIKKEADFVDWNDIEKIKKQGQEINSNLGKVKATIIQAYSFRHLKGMFSIILFLLVIITGFLLHNYVDFFKTQYLKIQPYILGTVVLLTQFLAFIKPAIRRVKKVSSALTSLGETIKELQVKEQEKHKGELDLARAEVDAAKAELHLLTLQQKDIEKIKTSLTMELADIRSGRKVTTFIESRLTDKKYIDNLGMISWIRKDFEQLDYLLKEQYSADQDAKTADLERVDTFKVDRIVLYVDDLDRCEAPIVVKVLEAIHLLLAFPLFVVIVGVDPRWMENALSEKYNHLKSDNSEVHKWQEAIVTPRAYLEKIFQIPFRLKEVYRNGFESLITSQFKTVTTIVDRSSNLNNSLIDRVLPNVVTRGPIPNSTNLASDDPDTFESFSYVSSIDQVNVEEQLNVAALLVLTEEELSFMKCLYLLVPSSPRTIKRFVNIYRIVRSHTDFKFDNENMLGYYQAAMIVLGILTAMPELATRFFEVLQSADEDDLFIEFMEQGKIINSYPDLTTWYRANADKIEFQNAGNIRLKAFLANQDLVNRFTFYS